MDLISALQHRLVYANVDDFYLLSRTALVKDEKNYDKFDRAFSAYFKGLEDLNGLLESLIPDEWLRHEFEKSLTPEDLGGDRNPTPDAQGEGNSGTGSLGFSEFWHRIFLGKGVLAPDPYD